MRSHVYIGCRIFLLLACKPHYVYFFLFFFSHVCITLNIVLIERRKYKVLGINVKFINKSKQKYASINTEYKNQ